MAGLNFDDPTSDSFKKFGILKIHDLMKVHFASLMWDFDHGSLPHVFQSFFTKISDIHSYHTRSSAADDLAKKICAKTIHGSKLFKTIGRLSSALLFLLFLLFFTFFDPRYFFLLFLQFCYFFYLFYFFLLF